MRRIAALFFTFVTTVGVTTVVRGQAPQTRRPNPKMAAPVPTPAEAKAAREAMDALLRKWEQKSAELTTLDVGFTRIDKNPGWGQTDEFRGRAYLQTPNLACLHFQMVTPAAKPGQNPVLKDHERIVCTGKEVLQYDYATKQIFRFPLARQDRKKALQEGPLPFLFNMKAVEVKARYTMTLRSETDKAYIIAIVPTEPQDRDVFSTAFLKLNKTSFLPDELVLVSPNGKDTQHYVFSGIQTNGVIGPKFFQVLTIRDWKMIDNPGQDEIPPRGGAPAGRPAVGRQPAQQPPQRR